MYVLCLCVREREREREGKRERERPGTGSGVAWFTKVGYWRYNRYENLVMRSLRFLELFDFIKVAKILATMTIGSLLDKIIW
jgi:hypothetical protein